MLPSKEKQTSMKREILTTVVAFAVVGLAFSACARKQKAPELAPVPVVQAQPAPAAQAAPPEPAPVRTAQRVDYVKK